MPDWFRFLQVMEDKIAESATWFSSSLVVFEEKQAADKMY